MSFNRNEAYSLFEALRPPPDGEVDRAIAATYSLDLVSLVGLVLALSGAPDDELTAGPIALVEAFTRMRGRLSVLCQKGRIAAARRHQKVLTLLDGMVHQVQSNERHGSWHPKLILVRYIQDNQATWRLWLGSRNLTSTRDLEAGLLLAGSPDGATDDVSKDVARLAKTLLKPSKLPESLVRELGTVRWIAPPGIRVNRILWRASGAAQLLFQPTGRCESTLAFSPFVDDFGARLLAGDSEKTSRLVTIQKSAPNIAPDLSIEVRLAGTPEPQDRAFEPATDHEQEDNPVPPNFGLHAKLIVRSQKGGAHLWIGSANLTKRGLMGPNAEVMAHLSVNKAVTDNLISFFEQCDVQSPQVENVDELLESENRALDLAVSDILQCQFELTSSDSGLTLHAMDGIDFFLKQYRLDVWLFTTPDETKEWRAGQDAVLLHRGGTPIGLQSAFVGFEARSRHDSNVKRSWTQTVDFKGLDREARNHAVLAAYIGPSRFRAWLRSVLEGSTPSEDEAWTGTRRPSGRRVARGRSNTEDLLSLEHVLGYWSRNPDRLEARIVELDAQLKAFRREIETNFEAAERENALTELKELEPFWNSLRTCFSKVGR